MPEDLAKDYKYKEVWEVFMSNQKEPYIMNEFEYAVFENAVTKGMKGVISFDWGMVNTSFFVSSYRKSRSLKEAWMPTQIEAPKERELTPEEKDKAQKRLDEIRARLKIKLSK
jgi:hypothetical protein